MSNRAPQQQQANACGDQGALQVISRGDAKKAGLRHFFTGRPCKNGHVALRYVSCGKCMPCDAGQWKRRFDNNRQADAERKKAWRAANTTKHSEYNKAWKAANRASENLRIKKMRDANPATKKAQDATRRARILSAEGKHTAADIVALFAEQKGRCAYCRAKVTAAKQHVDHIQPLFKGGTNSRSNLQILCAPCNLSKGAKDPLKFARERGLLL
jgi:hypothetical protein